MPVQKAYEATYLQAFAGQRRDLTLYDSISKAAEGSDIPFGLAVVAGTTDNQCKIPTAFNQRFLGISQQTTAGAVQAEGDHVYEENREVNIMTFGYVWVIPENAVTPGEQAYYRFAVNTTEQLGAITNNPDNGRCFPIPGGVFDTTADAGNLAVLSLKPCFCCGKYNLTDTNIGTDTVVSTLYPIILIDTSTGGGAANLADGYEGQELYLVMVAHGGDYNVDPVNFLGHTQITFNAAADSVTLVFVDGKWTVKSNYNATIV